MSKMEEIRRLAMECLQPSKKDLEHGLELHKNSYVFDSYGFMPTGGGKCPRLDELLEGNAGRDELIAASEEFRMCGSFDEPEIRKKLREAWEFSGVDCIFQNCGTEGNDIENMIHRLANYTCTLDKLSGFYERAVWPDQLPAIRERGHKTLYITTNGVPLPAKLVSTEEALTQIGTFFRLGVRMMHLTYNRRNLMGDGCAEKADAGLSDFGRMVIAEMNRIGVIPDVAHSGQRTSLEAALVSQKPVVASHSAAGGLSTHYRAKGDDVIEAIKKTNGYIGICGHPWFLQGHMDIRAMIDHIDYVAQKFGVDHVAIGTDHGFALDTVRTEHPVPRARRIWEQYWADPTDVNGTMTREQYDSCSWLNWPMFTVGLVQRGYSDGDIQKIIGGNVLRVIRETLA